MNNNNLVPIKSTERARELGSRGGKVKSKNKKMAAKLRELRKKGLTNEVAARLVCLIDDKDCFAIEILLLLEDIKKESHSVELKLKVANIMIQLLKTHHGERYKVQTENVHPDKRFWEVFHEEYEKLEQERNTIKL